MSDERPTDGAEPEDALPPLYRPWAASGVPQPGATRPGSDVPTAPDPGGRRGRVPPPPVPPEYPPDAGPATGPQWYAPAPSVPPAPVRPVPAGRYAPTTARSGFDRRLLASVLALVAVGTTWLPWFKTPGAGMFVFSDSRFVRVLNAWDVPARFVWSYHSPRSGPSLGWLVLGLAVAILALGFVGNARTAARVLAAVEALLVIMFLVQIGRIVDDTPTFGPADIGITDLVGLGAYVLLIVSMVLLVVPRD